MACSFSSHGGAVEHSKRSSVVECEDPGFSARRALTKTLGEPHDGLAGPPVRTGGMLRRRFPRAPVPLVARSRGSLTASSSPPSHVSRVSPLQRRTHLSCDAMLGMRRQGKASKRRTTKGPDAALTCCAHSPITRREHETALEKTASGWGSGTRPMFIWLHGPFCFASSPQAAISARRGPLDCPSISWGHANSGLQLAGVPSGQGVISSYAPGERSIGAV